MLVEEADLVAAGQVTDQELGVLRYLVKVTQAAMVIIQITTKAAAVAVQEKKEWTPTRVGRVDCNTTMAKVAMVLRMTSMAL